MEELLMLVSLPILANNTVSFGVVLCDFVAFYVSDGNW